MSFVTDPFDSLAVGFNGVPPGWSAAQNGLVRAGTDQGMWAAHNWFQYTGGNPLVTPFFGPARNVTAFFGYKNTNAAPGRTIFQFLSLQNDMVHTSQALTLTNENDQSLSVYCPGLGGPNTSGPNTLLGNSGSNIGYGFPIGSWFYIQFNVSILSILIGTRFFLNFTVEIAVDGNSVLSGAATSTMDASQFDGGNLGAGVNFGAWTQVGLSQLEIDTLQDINKFPFDRNPLTRISQLAIEPVIQPSTAAIRVSQLVNEWVKQPSTARVRISQLPIEVATQGTNQSQGWIVSEA